MLLRSLSAAALAAALMSFAPASASAADLSRGAQASVVLVGGYYRGARRYDAPRRFGRGGRCRPVRALRKARRLGVRKPFIYRVGRRGVVVRGRAWGERVAVRFGRGRRCPVTALGPLH